MPANLTPQYYEAEKRFREAKTPPEKIAALEEMLAVMPKHKGTDHLKAELRARLAKLSQMATKKSGAVRSTMLIDKEGAAQIVLIGQANSGKSQLLKNLTNAEPIIAEYPFTTITPIPGMMLYEDIQIQLIDMPPLIPNGVEWWFQGLLRRADALLIVIDITDSPIETLTMLESEITKMHLSLDIHTNRGKNGNIVWPKRALVVGTKADLDQTQHGFNLLQQNCKLPFVGVSSKDSLTLENLKKSVYNLLGIIRVYTKEPGRKPDLDDPVVLPVGSNLIDAAAEVHKDFTKKLKFARIWGSGKHDGVMVKRDHILHDKDIIELHISG
jgi:ribosome-interacting GTPase 1